MCDGGDGDVGGDGSGISLLVGERGSFSVVGTVASSQATIDDPATTDVIENELYNSVSITTSTEESDSSDNEDSHRVPVRIGTLASITGYVYVDVDEDVYRGGAGGGADAGLALVNIFVGGVERESKKILGPDAVAYPEQYVIWRDMVLADPSAYGLSSSVTSADMDSMSGYGSGVSSVGGNGVSVAGHRYIPVAPFVTGDDGAYAFSGLYPGVYSIMEVQPLGYVSTGSMGGYVGLVDDGNGNFVPDVNDSRDGRGSAPRSGSSSIQSDSNSIQRIIVESGSDSVENNFGEIDGRIGNQLFWDINQNGIYDVYVPGVGGDTPITGVTVQLYSDLDSDGVITSAGADGVAGNSDDEKMIGSVVTDNSGQYVFENLSVDDGSSSASYVVRVPIVDDVTNDMLVGMMDTSSIIGTSTADNESKPATGYAVSISGASRADMTADF